ncbi:MAG: ATP synthase F1 subunit epsilon [Clostridia bacterium]|nr:ATP synthase F1 subunit epsilon [Clostridia bacterium]
MKAFHIRIVTPDGLAYDGEVESLLVRTDDGDVEILAGHADLLASVSTGRARLLIDGKARFASVHGGFLSVCSGKVSMCAITFEFADQIDLKRAEEAKEKAEASIKAASDERNVRVAKAKLARAASRIKVASMK